MHSDTKLFEFLLLESAQAGLSWSIILRKREGYRRAFDNFDANKIASYDQRRLEQLLGNPGIIRNRLKIQSAIKNARAFLKLQQDCGSFDAGNLLAENPNIISGKGRQIFLPTQ